MKQKTKRVVSFRAAVERVFWRAKKRSLSARSSLSSLVGKKKQLYQTLSRRKKASYSPRALLFLCPTAERKKKCSPPRKHDPPWSVPLLPFDRRDLLPKFDRRRLESERWKVRVIFFLLPFFFKKNVCGFLARARAGTEMFRESKYDRRSERCIDNRKRERWLWWRFLICFLDLDLYRSLFLPLMMMREREKKAILWERDGASFLP